VFENPKGPTEMPFASVPSARDGESVSPGGAPAHAAPGRRSRQIHAAEASRPIGRLAPAVWSR
jgi:hypothetical protein